MFCIDFCSIQNQKTKEFNRSELKVLSYIGDIMSITTVTPLDENGDLGGKDDTIVENKVVEYEDRDPNNLNEHLQVKCNQ